ncbi:MAG: hypothetical protein IT165_22490 [Bryobacterales bacterium]|nr:hypothetical protein [Bryobacterales bacterium]
MSDFRKLLLAFVAITLFAGFASAQTTPPIVCSTTAQPLTVRTEGLTEQTGDVVISCTGGAVPTLGTALPQVNISVTLTSNITSRLLADPITEALLFIDDPQPGAQSPCAPASGSTVCPGLMAGAGGTAIGSDGLVRNVFQGVKQNDNTIVWLAVPINAPGSTAQRIYRTKNIRAAIAGISATNGQIFAYVSIQNPPANLQLNQASVPVAFVQQGLNFSLRSRSGGGFSGTASQVALYQCDNWNKDLADANTNKYTSGNGRSFELRYTEGYAASFKVRDVNGPLQDGPLNQNIPQNNNGADPSLSTVVESGFFNTSFTTTNGLNRAGRADHGTRLRVVFNNVPANVRLYVSAQAISNAAFVDSTVSTGGGESTAKLGAYGVAASSAGLNVAAGTVLANPLSPAEGDRSGGVYPASATANGLVELPVVSGSANFTWEIFGQDPNSIDVASFAVAVAYRSSNNPALGTATVNGSFAPVDTTNKMSATAVIPHFADQSTPNNSFSINTCLTTILFPFTTNQGGFDTGVAIANTSSDPFGTSPQSGNCELNYYGGTTGGGAAPSKQTTTSPVAGGQTLVFTLSSGGTNGVAATPGFQGYIIAICNFRYAHGFAFISDVGAQKLAQGYLGLILNPRPGYAGEALDN